MGFLTKWGGIWGAIPQTAGSVYWVAPGAGSYTVDGRSYSASDDNDGLSPERAFATVNRGVNLATNAGDVVVLLPGSHTPSASIAMDSANVTLMGLPGGAGNAWRNRATIGAVTGDQTINVTAANVEIAFVNIVPVTADTAIDFSAAASGLHVHHCYFDMATPAANTGTIGVEALGAAGRVRIANNVFDSDGAQGDAIVATATVDSVIEDNVFTLSAGTWASAVLCGAATDRLLIRRNSFVCSGTAITVGINGTGASLATGVLIHDNRFSSLVTVPIDNFDASECEISENYDAGVGAADGGVLITAIT